ncbi:MAG TPA: ribonuclease H [Candidatus Kapabacteria bacterium]|jgi:ribonuclease HI|nr:ribonuclease H [Candidatus Kapabacteria bacterium]HOM05481.1 ribonuclease H [Candidatus Kapabacteria bacterium]HOQ49254.1 ribonuclease H [Candidatus Kapabacteria bacterium]HPP38820.1 ribonuclease H [Candidatus Kapabacteria bacterium]HPU23080.1 ribonuclease H [Candidatus Kapabacteria bacterium]
MQKINIYTDGACLGNPGPGGWAFIAEIDGKIIEQSGYLPETTNNRAEYQAAIEAINYASQFSKEMQINTDSELLFNTMTKWIYSWQKKNWKKSDGKPVQNLDLVQKLWELVQKYKVHWNKVPAHSGIALNERCDLLAKEAASGKICANKEAGSNFTNGNLFENAREISSTDGKYKLLLKDDNTLELFSNSKKIAHFNFSLDVLINSSKER